jgi:hypothetical protein
MPFAPQLRNRPVQTGSSNPLGAICSNPRSSYYLTYTCDPVRRIVTVERTVGKVMFTLQF